MTTTEPRTEPLATQVAGGEKVAGRRRIQSESLLTRFRARLFGFFRRFWIWLAIIAVTAISAFGVFRLHGIFGVHGNEFGGEKVGGEITPYNVKVLTLYVWGPPGSTATISYLNEDSHPKTVLDEAIGGPPAKPCALPGIPFCWSAELRTTNPSLPANLVAQGTGSWIACKLSLDQHDGRPPRETPVNRSDDNETVNAFTFCLDKTL